MCESVMQYTNRFNVTLYLEDFLLFCEAMLSAANYFDQITCYSLFRFLFFLCWVIDILGEEH